jgi:hypothetical protein
LSDRLPFRPPVKLWVTTLTNRIVGAVVYGTRIVSHNQKKVKEILEDIFERFFLPLLFLTIKKR